MAMTDVSHKIQKARIATIILSLCGIALSYIALDQHVVYDNGFASGPSFCHINEYFNCEAVNASEWSVVFGIPVASYGLFFYTLILLGSFVASAPGRVISLASWSSIVLMLSGFASLLSVALFAVSELFIGSLCLMCIGLYLVNFLTFGCLWRSGWAGRVGEGIGTGVAEVWRLIGTTLGITRALPPTGAWALRATACVAILAAVVSAALPDFLYQVYAAQEMAPKDPLKEWRDAKVAQIDLNLQGGAFGDYYLGDPKAPIQIVEFADYECPACKTMSYLMKRLLESYKGSYVFVFKNYPLDQACNPEMDRPLHKFACAAAFFSRCAGEQGKFWEANTILFLRDADQGELSEESLISDGSKELGVNGDAMRECMSSGRYREVISRDIKAGATAGLFGTPSVWVNGKLVSQPSQRTFEAIFNSILQEKGMPTP
jgi:protein-disulfide isomerase/uncharacterized membrane protein